MLTIERRTTNGYVAAFLCALVLAMAILVGGAEAAEDLRLPRMISDHMVLQSAAEVPIWGWAEPGADVTVELAGETATTTANDDGRWQVTISTTFPSGSHTLAVRSGDETIRVEDVLFGEVWLASGQSNMEWLLKNTKTGDEAIENADMPDVRFFKVPHNAQIAPQNRLPDGEWKKMNPDVAGGYSAVAFFFARFLHKKLNTPVGVIQSAWGGTPAEAWTPRGGLSAVSELNHHVEQLTALEEQHDDLVENWDSYSEKWQKAFWQYRREKRRFQQGKRDERPEKPDVLLRVSHLPTALYNGMIHPLIPYRIRGSIWYQGESNAHGDAAREYATLFSTMIRQWREKWNRGEFPFLFVQLPEWKPGGEAWCHLRESQRQTTLQVNNSAMVATLGLGHPEDIHPKHKEPVGERLGRAALSKAYGMSAIWSGPLLTSAVRRDGGVRLSFDLVNGGLKAGDQGLKEFEVSADGEDWKEAEARIEGDHVVVSHPDMEKPRYVRYAWKSLVQPSLFNREGLPASPFLEQVQTPGTSGDGPSW